MAYFTLGQTLMECITAFLIYRTWDISNVGRYLNIIHMYRYHIFSYHSPSMITSNMDFNGIDITLIPLTFS